MTPFPAVPRIAIGIATRGRAEVLAETLGALRHQTRRADRVIVCHVTEADVVGVRGLAEVRFIVSAAGLARQRNAILDGATDCDIVLFLDDDFLPGNGYIAATLAAFGADPGVVVTTGNILADGACGPGLSVAEGRAILAHYRPDARRPPLLATFNGYGCNMAIRLDEVRQRGLRFDERLPLYGWYEDVDFTRRLASSGRIVEVSGAFGVHLGTKLGRTSGRRLGYSQVANPLYLWRKGSYPLDRAVRSVGRHLLINGARSVRPEPWVDRRGRLRGNALALLDILRGKLAPERILEL